MHKRRKSGSSRGKVYPQPSGAPSSHGKAVHQRRQSPSSHGKEAIEERRDRTSRRKTRIFGSASRSCSGKGGKASRRPVFAAGASPPPRAEAPGGRSTPRLQIKVPHTIQRLTSIKLSENCPERRCLHVVVDCPHGGLAQNICQSNNNVVPHLVDVKQGLGCLKFSAASPFVSAAKARKRAPNGRDRLPLIRRSFLKSPSNPLGSNSSKVPNLDFKNRLLKLKMHTPPFNLCTSSTLYGDKTTLARSDPRVNGVAFPHIKIWTL